MDGDPLEEEYADAEVDPEYEDGVFVGTTKSDPPMFVKALGSVFVGLLMLFIILFLAGLAWRVLLWVW